MIRAIVLDFFNVITIPRFTEDAQHAIVKDPTGMYRLNTELLKYCKAVQEEKGIPVYLFTASTPDEYAWLRGEMDWMAAIYTCWKMGLHKGDADSYTELATHINIDPSEIVFIDDSSYNIVAAHKAGWQTIQYINNKDTFTQLESLL